MMFIYLYQTRRCVAYNKDTKNGRVADYVCVKYAHFKITLTTE